MILKHHIRPIPTQFLTQTLPGDAEPARKCQTRRVMPYGEMEDIARTPPPHAIAPKARKTRGGAGLKGRSTSGS